MTRAADDRGHYVVEGDASLPNPTAERLRFVQAAPSAVISLPSCVSNPASG
jgi:hypothetical protein